MSTGQEAEFFSRYFVNQREKYLSEKIIRLGLFNSIRCCHNGGCFWFIDDFT
jgi:hypothetical protein